MSLNKIRLENAQVLISIDSLNVVNLDFIIERLKQKPDSLKTKWSVMVSNIEMADSRFILKIFENEKFVGPGVDLNNMDLRNWILN